MAGRRRAREGPAERRERHAAVTDVSTVLDAAARFLETRSRSVDEVRRRLLQAGYRAEVVEEAIERLGRQGYLDDEAFARAWVESRDRARPRGERALRQELARKGIARELVDTVIGERDADAAASGVSEGSADEGAARRLLERHRRALDREPDPARRRHRAYALLARSGFDPDVSRTLAATVVEPDSGEDLAPD